MRKWFLFTIAVINTFISAKCDQPRMLNIHIQNFNYTYTYSCPLSTASRTNTVNSVCFCGGGDLSTCWTQSVEGNNIVQNCSQNCDTLFRISVVTGDYSTVSSVESCPKSVSNTSIIHIASGNNTFYTFSYFTESPTLSGKVIIEVYNYNMKGDEIDQFEIILQSLKDSVQQTLTGNKKTANLSLTYSFSRNDCCGDTPLNFSSCPAHRSLASETPVAESCNQSSGSSSHWMIAALVLMVTTTSTSTACVAIGCFAFHNRRVSKTQSSGEPSNQQSSGIGQMDNPVYDAVAFKKSTKAPQSVVDLPNMHQVYRHVVNELYSPGHKVEDHDYYRVGPIKTHKDSLYDLATECMDEHAQCHIYDTPPPEPQLESDDESEYATVRFEK